MRRKRSIRQASTTPSSTSLAASPTLSSTMRVTARPRLFRKVSLRIQVCGAQPVLSAASSHMRATDFHVRSPTSSLCNHCRQPDGAALELRDQALRAGE
eukprot:scaffold7055_cov254-Pinguiococcus_pyrenoidosus.AAC.5